MSLLSNLVGLASSLTVQFGLQADITYRVFVHSDGAGGRHYDSEEGTVRKALYIRKQKYVRTFSGEMAVSGAQVVLLDPQVVNEFDLIKLPNTTEWQSILGTDAFVDASNGPILTEIFLGPSLNV